MGWREQNVLACFLVAGGVCAIVASGLAFGLVGVFTAAAVFLLSIFVLGAIGS